VMGGNKLLVVYRVSGRGPGPLRCASGSCKYPCTFLPIWSWRGTLTRPRTSTQRSQLRAPGYLMACRCRCRGTAPPSCSPPVAAAPPPQAAVATTNS
jgi:hypothetical protein